ncbi:MAG: DUF2007 domain-containing protein [Acidobacteria bacterium]|jgi:hypothetical protein|nr:DUF2007 domain-containing protein [Acidobacteriota bacterium]
MTIESERQRLAQLYAGMSLGELQKVAEDAASLTEVAREALHAEIARRNQLGDDVQEGPLQAAISPEPEQRDLVLVRRFRDLPEALLAKGALDSAGIPCFLADDNMVRMDWFISNLLGGAKLLVDRENLHAAIELLDHPIPEIFEVEGIGEYEQPRCPRCQSLDIHFEDLDKQVAYVGLFASIPIPYYRHRWKCAACGLAWKEEEESGDAEDGGSPSSPEGDDAPKL